MERVLTEPREAVLAAIEDSGLRGRGGAGFPTGLKWRAAAEQAALPKYIVANADEGDAGAFSDRFLMEDDPHALIEGMAIAAHATGATHGWIYLRHEYPAARTALGPLIDPNEHSCGTVRPHGHRELAHPEPGFYTLGVKSYGRAPTFLMATGYEQVRSVVAKLAGDMQAAREVRLVLPETGVCSRPLAPDASNCCGGPAISDVDACCVADAQAKQDGKTGCGCAS